MTYRVGTVVLGSGLAAAGGAVLDIVHGVGRCVRVRGLLCNHVGEVWRRMSTKEAETYGLARLTAGGVLFLVVVRHDDWWYVV
jgi:hypothetical protein